MLFGLHICCLVGTLSSEEVSSNVWSSGADGHAVISEDANLGQREVQVHQTLMRTERAEAASLASMEANSKVKADQLPAGYGQNYGSVPSVPTVYGQNYGSVPSVQAAYGQNYGSVPSVQAGYGQNYGSVPSDPARYSQNYGSVPSVPSPYGTSLENRLSSGREGGGQQTAGSISFEKIMSLTSPPQQPPQLQQQPRYGQLSNINYGSAHSSNNYGVAARQQPVSVQQPLGQQLPLQSPLVQHVPGQQLSTASIGQTRAVFPRSSDQTRHHGRGPISPEQEAQDDAMPLDPDDPKAGARCIIPMWSKTLYACEEHEEVPKLNNFADGNGVQRKALEDGDDCTVICPSPRWWQTPSEETITCKDGIFHVENGTRVKEIECETSTGFILMSLFGLVIISAVSGGTYMGKEEMMRLYDEHLARHLGPLPGTKHDEHDDDHPEHTDDEAELTDGKGGDEAKKEVQPESVGKDAKKEGEEAKKEVQPDSGGIKQDGASASGS